MADPENELDRTARSVHTLEEVNALLPALSRIVGEQLRRREEIERSLTELAGLTHQARGDLTLRAEDGADVRERKRGILARIDAYQRGWTKVEELGGVLKDPARGLVDFYGVIEDKLVWLCWCYGEDEVGHWHRLDEGFSSRRPIDALARKYSLS